MREQGVVYDTKTGGFFHVYSDGSKTIIDRQPCQHDHFVVVGAR
ncbi:MAG: hypothetical protein ACXWMI_08500 [Syntrophales bacterium]